MGKFELDLTRIANKYKDRIDVVVGKITIDMFSEVIDMSPVDKGGFKGAWVASLGGYSSDIPDTPDKDGDRTIGKMIGVVNANPSGGVMYMVNNQPYSIKLEYGWSKQAPVGMVRLTIARHHEHLTNQISKLR